MEQELQNQINELIARINADEDRHKRDEEGVLRELSIKLRPIYEDFNETVDDPIDVEMGEMYRKIIQKMFKILANNNIRLY